MLGNLLDGKLDTLGFVDMEDLDVLYSQRGCDALNFGNELITHFPCRDLDMPPNILPQDSLICATFDIVQSFKTLGLPAVAIPSVA